VAAVAVPGSAGEALAMAEASLRWLAAADVASLPAAAQAGALRALERLQSVQAAARARVLAGFTARRGFEADGQGSARTWLTWQTRITPGAARAAVASMRRLEDHPAVAEALAEAAVSVSWARHITGWTDALPVENRQDADVILLAAAAGGADLAGLAGLAEEIRRRVAGPDGDGDDGFLRRGLQLDTTLGGAGRLTGNLSARCAAALQEVLDAVGARHGPEDTRTVQQRRHDALEDACTRLLAAGCLPDRAGQPARLQLHLSLDQFLHGTGRPGRPWLPPGFGGLPGPGPAGSGGAGGGGAGGGEDPGPGLLPGAWAGPGDDCDAALAPVVTGRVDHHLLDRLAARLAGTWAGYDPARTPCDRGGLPGCAGPHGRRDPDGAGEDADAGGAGTVHGGRPRAHPPQRRRAAIRARRPRLVAAHRDPAPARRLHQPPARCRRRHRPGPPAPAPRDHHPGPALRRPRLRHPAPRLPRAPHRAAQPGRHHQPGKLHTFVLVSPPDHDPPVGLDHHPARRRHHHRHQPPRPRPAQPQPTHRGLVRPRQA
jgi:hypothetical protein